MFDFLNMIHVPQAKKDSDQSRLYVPQEILEQCHDIPKLEGLLESAFPVQDVWMDGQLDATHVERPDIEQLEDYLESLWDKLRRRLQIDDRETPRDYRRRYVGTVTLRNRRVMGSGSEPSDGKQREKSFQMELRSQVVGSATYDPKRKKHLVTVQGDRLFDLKTTQWQEIEALIVRTVEVADRIESEMLECDEDARYLNVVRKDKKR